MKKNVSYAELTKAYTQAAKIVSIYGEKYLPIFERLEKEHLNRKEKKDILDRAIKIANLDKTNTK